MEWGPSSPLHPRDTRRGGLGPETPYDVPSLGLWSSVSGVGPSRKSRGPVAKTTSSPKTRGPIGVDSTGVETDGVRGRGTGWFLSGVGRDGRVNPGRSYRNPSRERRTDEVPSPRGSGGRVRLRPRRERNPEEGGQSPLSRLRGAKSGRRPPSVRPSLWPSPPVCHPSTLHPPYQGLRRAPGIGVSRTTRWGRPGTG